MSKFRLEIELRQDIPSRINIQGNPINVLYKNQPRSCFVCREAGHEAKNCPRRVGPACPLNKPTGPLSFAEITAGAKTPAIPEHTDEVIADPPSTKEPGQQPKAAEPTTMVVEESAALTEPKTISLSEVQLVPPPQPEPFAPPAQPVVETNPSSEHTVVPPAGDKNVRPLSVEESNMDTHPPPVLDDLESSTTAEPSTQELFKQLENTLPTLQPRPSVVSELSDPSQSATGTATSSPLKSLRSKSTKRTTTSLKRLSSTLHGSGRNKTLPSMATSGKKKSSIAKQSTLPKNPDEED